jgi:hypothetical protein
MKSSTSPKTGERITTFASNDQAFEFHLKPDQIQTINFVQVPKSEDKIMRICRMVNKSGGSICSLILMDSTDGAIDWFEKMEKK